MRSVNSRYAIAANGCAGRASGKDDPHKLILLFHGNGQKPGKTLDDATPEELFDTFLG